MSSLTPHPDPETLLRLADDDLSPADAGCVRDHLAECGACRDRMDGLGGLLTDVHHFHQSVIKPGLPDPPREWSNPRWSKLARPFPTRRYLAAAAAVLAAAVLLRWIERPAQVSAAELLQRAEIREQTAAPAPRRIRIRSKNRSWTRAARLDHAERPRNGDAAAVARMLEDAGYPWEDPLTAASFAVWRDRLPGKHDDVRKSDEAFVVTTSTSAGAIEVASLTLRATDLHAVSATLRFRSDETLEMSELPAETPQPAPPNPPDGAPPSVSRTIPRIGASEELRVIVALHDIGADLGDPIEVKRNEESIDVTVAGLSAARREQIRSALDGIPGVRIAFEREAGRHFGNTSPPRSVSPVTNPANPLVPDMGDVLIDASDRAVEHAHALAALARRFSRAVEASLDNTGRAELQRIAADHLNAISAAAHQLRVALKTTASPGVNVPDWQEAAEGILQAAMDADQELNSAASDVEGRLARLRAAVARLP